MTDTAASAKPATCAYPGCARPVPEPTGPGRPPAFCDDPEHTAMTAFEERARLEEELGTGGTR